MIDNKNYRKIIQEISVLPHGYVQDLPTLCALYSAGSRNFINGRYNFRSAVADMGKVVKQAGRSVLLKEIALTHNNNLKLLFLPHFSDCERTGFVIGVPRGTQARFISACIAAGVAPECVTAQRDHSSPIVRAQVAKHGSVADRHAMMGEQNRIVCRALFHHGDAQVQSAVWNVLKSGMTRLDADAIRRHGASHPDYKKWMARVKLKY